LANAAIAASRAILMLPEGERVHIHGQPSGDATARKMRPITTLSASTS
jgi:hypothetical protein